MTDEAEADNSNRSRGPCGARCCDSALQYGASALVFYILFRFLPAHQVLATLERLSAQLWLLAIAGYLAAHLIGAVKYRLVLNMGGAGLSPSNAARCYFAGLFGSLFLPSLIGGDILRIAMALRVGRSKAAVFLGSLVDRLSDFTALVLLAAVGAVLVPGGLSEKDRNIFLLVIAAVAVAGVIALGLIALFPVRKLSSRSGENWYACGKRGAKFFVNRERCCAR